MDNVYINIKDFGELYIGKYLYKEFNKDIISVAELIGTIEDLIDESESYKEKYEELTQNKRDEFDDFDDRWHSGEFK